MEAADVVYWSENGNLSAFFNSSRAMPVALRDGAKAFASGYHSGLDEKYEQQKKENG